MTTPAFTFADLFAGIGGFHAALTALGGECAFVSEIDDTAREIYAQNWGDEVGHGESRRPLDDDIIPLTESTMKVPITDLLAAGFPCQPFSKSGFQRGINETRGTLFFNILRILQERRPPVILLENVRNLAGPRHEETWAMIVRQLRDTGYKVSGTPTVFSPHFLPPDMGGAPQIRDRVFILGTYVGSKDRAWALSTDEPVVARAPVCDTNGVLWSPDRWDLETTVLPHVGGPLLQAEDEYTARYRLSDVETEWIDLWDDFVTRLREARGGIRLEGFPLWADSWVHIDDLTIPKGTPAWKVDFLLKNATFYTKHQDVIDAWRADWFADPCNEDDQVAWVTRVREHAKGGVFFPPSRRKLEWQAQDTPSLWETVMHLRPSGIRAKRATYLPALVAITQTSIIGPRRRRLTPVEAARLQGLPDTFTFDEQPDSATYKQLGNGVSAGAAYYVLREHVKADRLLIKPQRIVDAILNAPDAPQITPHTTNETEARGTAVAKGTTTGPRFAGMKPDLVGF